jgi:hypothetical protein
MEDICKKERLTLEAKQLEIIINVFNCDIR